MIFATLLAICGMLGIALSTDRHRPASSSRDQLRLLRAAGVSLLAVSLARMVSVQGIGIGTVTAVMTASLAVIMVAAFANLRRTRR